MDHLFRYADRTFGRCVFCMQKAFVAALSTSLIPIIIVWFAGSNELTTTLFFGAAAMTALWAAHVIAFAGRTWTRNSLQRSSALTSVPSVSRRQLGLHFVRLLGSTAVLSATVFGAGSALAANCDCSKCSSSQVCCKTANGACGCFPKGIQC
jgi:hypothetical protein